MSELGAWQKARVLAWLRERCGPCPSCRRAHEDATVTATTLLGESPQTGADALFSIVVVRCMHCATVQLLSAPVMGLRLGDLEQAPWPEREALVSEGEESGT